MSTFEDALDRRFELLNFISEKKQTTYLKIKDEFQISRPTIAKDIRFLEKSLGVPIFTAPGPAGGVTIKANWLPSYIFLSPYERFFLIKKMNHETDPADQSKYWDLLINHVSPELRKMYLSDKSKYLILH